MFGNNPLDSCQTYARAFKFLIAMKALESHKQSGGLAHVEPDAIVANEENIFLISVRSGPNGDDGVLAAAGELDGIGQQVPEHLRDQPAIAFDSGQRGNFKGHIPSGYFRFQAPDNLLYDCLKVGRLKLQSLFTQAGEAQ